MHGLDGLKRGGFALTAAGFLALVPAGRSASQSPVSLQSPTNTAVLAASAFVRSDSQKPTSVVLLGIPPDGDPAVSAETMGSGVKGLSARVLWTGFLREQRVAAIEVDMGTNGEHRDSVKVEATFFCDDRMEVDTADTPSPGDGFERVYGSVLANYDQAKKWRERPGSDVRSSPSSMLGTAAEDADYLIVAADNLVCQALYDLAELRCCQGFTPCIVPISSIPGGATDVAIKSFISNMYYTGKRPPVYVLLVGDANIDHPSQNLVPTHYPSGGESQECIGDEWYACVAGDDHLADLFIGRIPADSQQELAGYLEKIQTNESTPLLRDWHHNCLFIYTIWNGGDALYPRLSQDCIPSEWHYDSIRYEDYDYDDEAFENAVISKFAAPSYSLVVVLNGTNSGCMMGAGGFCDEDEPRLTNDGRYPFIYFCSCDEGFDYNYPRAVSEGIVLEAHKGAIGAIVPIRILKPAGTDFKERFSEILLEEMLKNQVPTAGEAAAIAKIRYQIEEPWFWSPAYQMQLLGDPGLRLMFNSMKDVETAVGNRDMIEVDTGVDSWDLTGDGKPDILMGGRCGLYTNPWLGKVRLVLAKNLDLAGHPHGETQEYVFNLPVHDNHDYTYGLGLAIGDLGPEPDGKPDVVIVVPVDEPSNKFAMIIGRGVRLDQYQNELQFDSWSSWIYLPSDIYLLNGRCTEIGADLCDVTNDGELDLVIVAFRGGQPFEYAIVKNLRVDGSVAGWKTGWADASSPPDTHGLTCLVRDADGDGIPDLVASFVSDQDPQLIHKIGYNMSFVTGVYEWSPYLYDHDSWLTRYPSGLGSAAADVNADGRDEFVLVSNLYKSYEETRGWCAFKVVRSFHQQFTRSGFEADDTPALQYTLGSGITNLTFGTARTIEDDGQVSPRSGHRYFKILGEDQSTGQSKGRVVLFDRSFLVTAGMHCSYWVYVRQAPENHGHIGLDFGLDSGLASEQYSVFDQYGKPMRQSQRQVPLGSWQRYVYDLTPLAGQVVNQIVVAYDDGAPGVSGAFTAYIDEVKLMTPPADADPAHCIVQASGDNLLFCPADCADTLSVTLTVKDHSGQPIAGIDPEDVYVVISDVTKLCGSFRHCSGWRTWTPMQATDQNGQTRVDLWGAIGGCLSIEAAGYLCGERIGADTLLLHSYDINGTGLVDGTDLSIFAGYYGKNNWCGDFKFDHKVDAFDLMLFVTHYAHTCEDVDWGFVAEGERALDLSLMEVSGDGVEGTNRAYVVTFENLPGYRGFDLEVSIPEGSTFVRWEPSPAFEEGLAVGPLVSDSGRRVRIAAANPTPSFVQTLSPGALVVDASGESAGEVAVTYAQVCGPDFESLVYVLGSQQDTGGETTKQGAALNLYPSPFSEKVTLSLDLPDTRRVRLSVYDTAGRAVRTFAETLVSPGRYEFVWDGRDDSGRLASSGIYFVHVRAGRLVETRKIVLVK